MDVKTMAKLTRGKYERIYTAEQAIEKIFTLGGISIDEYCEYEKEFFEEIINLFGQITFDRFIERRYGD